jgi:hypothetical protein
MTFDHHNNAQLRALLAERDLSDATRQAIAAELARRHQPGAGQLAYEEDCRREPNYANGRPRPAWDQLDHVARQSWNLFPTPRARQRA